MIDLYKKVEKLKLTHETCEDPWYSCPKSEEGCANDNQGDECTCGADYHNEKVNETLEHLDKLISLRESEGE